MAQHKKTITCISWHPKNPDLLATSSTDSRIYVWSVSQQRVIATLENSKSAPITSIGWCPHDPDCIAYMYGRGPMHIWNYTSADGGVLSKHLESMTFFSAVCQFRWNQRKIGKLVLGHNDGSISVISPGQKAFKHYLRPESVDDPDDQDPVTSLEWDPLSVDYLLVSNAHHGMRLIDTDSMSVIMNFKLPSSAIKIHTLAWVPSAPGVFVTGGKYGNLLVRRGKPILTYSQ